VSHVLTLPPPKMSDLLRSVTCPFSMTHHAKFRRPGSIAKIIISVSPVLVEHKKNAAW
jgi:hypothetical protein